MRDEGATRAEARWGRRRCDGWGRRHCALLEGGEQERSSLAVLDDRGARRMWLRSSTEWERLLRLGGEEERRRRGGRAAARRTGGSRERREEEEECAVFYVGLEGIRIVFYFMRLNSLFIHKKIKIKSFNSRNKKLLPIFNSNLIETDTYKLGN